MVDRLDRLRHDAVVRRDHDYRYIRDFGAALTHCGERFVTGRIEESYRLSVEIDRISAYMLGYAARFAFDDVALADIVEQGGLAVVDVSHDSHDGRTRFEMSVLLFFKFKLAQLVFRGDVGHIGERYVVIDGDQFRGFEVDRVVYRAHLAHIEEFLDDLRGAFAYLFAENLDRYYIRVDFGMVYLCRGAHIVLALRSALFFVSDVAVLAAVFIDIAFFDQIALGERLFLFVFLRKSALFLFVIDAFTGHGRGGRRNDRSPSRSGTPVGSGLRSVSGRKFSLSRRGAVTAPSRIQKFGIDISLGLGGFGSGLSGLFLRNGRLDLFHALALFFGFWSGSLLRLFGRGRLFFLRYCPFFFLFFAQFFIEISDLFGDLIVERGYFRALFLYVADKRRHFFRQYGFDFLDQFRYVQILVTHFLPPLLCPICPSEVSRPPILCLSGLSVSRSLYERRGLSLRSCI